VTKVLRAYPKVPQFTSVEWDLIHGVAVLLKPFNEIMIKTQAQKYITLSMVVPLLQDLEEDAIYHKIAAEMIVALNTRFDLSLNGSCLKLLAAALDP